MMAMHRTFRDLVAPLDADPVRRAGVEAEMRAMRDVEAVMRLRTERPATQRTNAETPATARGPISMIGSRIDEDTDIYLATLRHYIAEIGGRIAITAVFPGETIQITPLACDEPVSAAQ